MEDNKAMSRGADYYWRKAKIMWIIAGVFAVLALIGRILILMIEILERQ